MLDLLPLRPAETVMRLARLGSFHPTRLSFMPTLLRHIRAGGWRFDRPLWRIGADGTGLALYRLSRGAQSYTLAAFAHDLPAEQRSDRVIATAWDATFTLFDGMPTEKDIERLAAQVPLQEAGRLEASELVLSRANRSIRLWSHVVERLAAGRQPDLEEIAGVGYLMRTTAVYGSSKFGTADRTRLMGRPLLDGPFRAEMLAVWLIRAFSLDLVEDMARAANPAAARLAPELRRRLGIGNSTGLGMAPFLVTHPALLHRWIAARETALARVRGLGHSAGWEAFRTALEDARRNAALWQSAHPYQKAKLADLTRDLDLIAAQPRPQTHQPWDSLWRWGAANLSLEGQEQLFALLLAPHGAEIDDLDGEMTANETEAARIDGAMDIADLRNLICRNYAWALGFDAEARAANARFWYVSEEKLEPRLGQRFEEPGASREQPLAVARDIARLAAALEDTEGPVAGFLLRQPQHRHALRRVQLSASRPYAEIRDNLIRAEMLPIDLLRAKLAMFGATRFDPRSDRWLRITMFQDAPLPQEFAADQTIGNHAALTG